MHVGFVKRVKVFFGHISSKMKQCIKIWETFDATDLAATVVGGDGTIPYLHKWSTGIGKFCTLEYSASGKYLPKNLRLENRWHLKSGCFLASNQWFFGKVLVHSRAKLKQFWLP